MLILLWSLCWIYPNFPKATSQQKNKGEKGETLFILLIFRLKVIEYSQTVIKSFLSCRLSKI